MAGVFARRSAMLASLLRLLSDLLVQQGILATPLLPPDSETIEPRLLCVVVAYENADLGVLGGPEAKVLRCGLLHYERVAKMHKDPPLRLLSKLRVPAGTHYVVQLRKPGQTLLPGLGHCVLLSDACGRGSGLPAALFRLCIALLEEEPYLHHWDRSHRLPEFLRLAVSSGHCYIGPSIEDFVRRVGSAGASAMVQQQQRVPVPVEGAVAREENGSPAPQPQPSPAPRGVSSEKRAERSEMGTQTISPFTFAHLPADTKKYQDLRTAVSVWNDMLSPLGRSTSWQETVRKQVWSMRQKEYEARDHSLEIDQVDPTGMTTSIF
jgi:hypothetical protein